MAPSEKQLHELKSALKRREQRPETTYASPTSLELSKRERDRITNSSTGILLSVESLLVEAWKKNPELDDLDAEQALVTAIRRRVAEDEGIIKSPVQDLEKLRSHWNDLDTSDEDWTNVLRVILASVKTHSSGLKGSRSYLNYAVGFLAHAKRDLDPIKPGAGAP